MKNTDISYYLIQLGHYERKLEYCREILMSIPEFSPIDLYHRIDLDARQQFTLQELQEFCQSNPWNIDNVNCSILFDFFDRKKDKKVSAKTFIDVLLPLTYLMNPKMKQKIYQTNTSSTMTPEVYFAIQKLFEQAIENERNSNILRQKLGIVVTQVNSQEHEINQKELKFYLNCQNRYPDDRCISLILRSLKRKINLIRTLSQHIKQIRIYSQTPLHELKFENLSEIDERSKEPSETQDRIERETNKSKSKHHRRDSSNLSLGECYSIESGPLISETHTENQQIHEKLVTFSSMKDLKFQNSEQEYLEKTIFTKPVQGKDTPYKLLLTPAQKQGSNTVTPRKDTQIYKPAKLIKKPQNLKQIGKQNCINSARNRQTPLKREEIMKVLSQQEGLRDLTKQITNRI